VSKVKTRAFTLTEVILVIAIMISVMLAMVAMIGPMKRKKPIDVIKNHGTVECYWTTDEEGNLKLTQFEANNTTNREGTISYPTDGYCTFEVPIADYYTLQAIGAGHDGYGGSDGDYKPEFTLTEQEPIGGTIKFKNFGKKDGLPYCGLGGITYIDDRTTNDYAFPKQSEKEGNEWLKTEWDNWAAENPVAVTVYAPMGGGGAGIHVRTFSFEHPDCEKTPVFKSENGEYVLDEYGLKILEGWDYSLECVGDQTADGGQSRGATSFSANVYVFKDSLLTTTKTIGTPGEPNKFALNIKNGVSFKVVGSTPGTHAQIEDSMLKEGGQVLEANGGHASYIQNNVKYDASSENKYTETNSEEGDFTYNDDYQTFQGGKGDEYVRSNFITRLDASTSNKYMLGEPHFQHNGNKQYWFGVDQAAYNNAGTNSISNNRNAQYCDFEAQDYYRKDSANQAYYDARHQIALKRAYGSVEYNPSSVSFSHNPIKVSYEYGQSGYPGVVVSAVLPQLPTSDTVEVRLYPQQSPTDEPSQIMFKIGNAEPYEVISTSTQTLEPEKIEESFDLEEKVTNEYDKEGAHTVFKDLLTKDVPVQEGYEIMATAGDEKAIYSNISDSYKDLIFFSRSNLRRALPGASGSGAYPLLWPIDKTVKYIINDSVVKEIDYSDVLEETISTSECLDKRTPVINDKGQYYCRAGKGKSGAAMIVW